MNVIKKIEIFGDSILKGIQVNPLNKKYYVDNNIDIQMLSSKFLLNIKNYSKFGCTIEKGKMLLEKHMKRGAVCDAIVMDYGGNDCDFNWKEISDNPDEEYQPNTPITIFTNAYKNIITALKQKGILPVLTNLPPLDPKRFFEWNTKSLNKENVMKWLGSVNAIYRFQENYSRIIEKIAISEKIPLVDIRGAFLKNRRIEHLLCEDGTHPNTEGQKVITSAFSDFAGQMLMA